MAKFLGVMKDEIEIKSIKVGATNAYGPVVGFGKISVSLTPVSVAAATCAEQGFTVPGARVGDMVTITPPGITAGVAPVCARVAVDNAVVMTFCNATAGPLVPAAGIYQVQITR